MQRKTLTRAAIAACLAGAVGAAAATLPSDARAAEPVMTQGTPTFFSTTQHLTASVPMPAPIFQRWVAADIWWNGGVTMLQLTGGFPATQSFTTWNIVTCSGGATSVSNITPQPRVYSSVPPVSASSSLKQNWSRCSAGLPAWTVAMIDLQ